MYFLCFSHSSAPLSCLTPIVHDAYFISITSSRKGDETRPSKQLNKQNNLPLTRSSTSTHKAQGHKYKLARAVRSGMRTQAERAERDRPMTVTYGGKVRLFRALSLPVAFDTRTCMIILIRSEKRKIDNLTRAVIHCTHKCFTAECTFSLCKV